jgi:hypothetical protein
MGLLLRFNQVVYTGQEQRDWNAEVEDLVDIAVAEEPPELPDRKRVLRSPEPEGALAAILDKLLDVRATPSAWGEALRSRGLDERELRELLTYYPKLAELLIDVDSWGTVVEEPHPIRVDNRRSEPGSNRAIRQDEWVTILKVFSLWNAGPLVAAFCAARLSSLERAVWLMRTRFFLDLTPKEVADRLAMETTTVSTKLFNANAIKDAALGIRQEADK